MQLDNEFPFANTEAAIMLLNAIKARKAEGTSLRTLAKQLGYAQATVLSHMSKGRVPIPLERVGAIAKALEIDPTTFGKAVILQRFPDMARVVEDGLREQDDLVHTLQLITGKGLDSLTEEQKFVLKEVVADPQPGRRWLSVAELPLVSMLRRDVPQFSAGSLSRSDVEAMVALVEGK